ncbi:hypothetical protein SUGI_0003070 [Cryptomeria japonica]|uniref:meiotic recombination protein SPO11-2 n=1 Tax=Cryptomeria japonica TaxID=3369 RepID=UPI002408B942|nr:meiotic recombination protein SPO11-2 [Cryptomeria japonica]GLJ04774.1 hypothetical protein SUGI_0003070 [Cryptomeria japonica]
MAEQAATLFHSDQHHCYAEILTPEQVQARIKVIVLRFLKYLSSPDPSICDLPLVCRTANNTKLRQGCFGDVDSIFLSYSMYKRSFMKKNVEMAFVRVWKVLELCFQLLVIGKQATQREVFYRLLSDSPKYFSSQVQVNRAIQDVVALVQCSRHSLGIMASSRGAVVGKLVIYEPNGDIVDCTVLGPSGHLINGNLHLLQKWVFESDARYVILVEKDAIFQRLAEDRIYNYIPSIMITGKGYPDLASRILLHRLSRSFPNLLILALVDWNPAGLAIVCTYKFGSIAMGLEASKYVCDVKWLGLRGSDLQLVPENARLKLKPRDHQLAKSLLSSKMLQNQMKYKEELLYMVQAGHRVEIEALYCHGYGFLAQYVATKIVQADYI